MNPAENIRPARPALALVRAAFGKPHEPGPFEGLTPEEWLEVYGFSSRQGVLPLAYDGLAALPEAAKPPKSLALRWGVNAEVSAERYAARKNALASLAGLYAGHGIRMLVIKGYGMSLYYPIPEHRECGDIDIYLFGDFDRGNHLMEDSGAEIKPEGAKHSAFVFGGTIVENHRYIVGARKNRRLKHVESVLERLAEKESDAVRVGDSDVWLPSATFNAIYLLAHAASHFAGGELAVRNLCDWARFLEAESGNIDRELFAETTKKARLDKLCGLMTAFAEDNLGLPPQGFPRPEAGIYRKFGDMVLGYRTVRIPENESLAARIRRVWGTRWRSADVLDESFFRELLYTAKYRRKGRKQAAKQRP